MPEKYPNKQLKEELDILMMSNPRKLVEKCYRLAEGATSISEENVNLRTKMQELKERNMALQKSLVEIQKARKEITGEKND